MSNNQTLNINSGHVAKAIDSQLIQLVKVLQVENSAEFEDALNTARQYLNGKVVELMLEEDKANVISVAKNVYEQYKNNPKDDTLKEMYSLCKFFGLYNLDN